MDRKSLKFKVGDKVRVKAGNINEGCVAVISALKGDHDAKSLDSWDYELNFSGVKSATALHDGIHSNGKKIYRYYDEFQLVACENKTPAAKYKPGDTVRVRSDLSVGIYYGSNGTKSIRFNPQMAYLKGKEVKISKVNKSGSYLVEGCIFAWNEDMFVNEKETKTSTTEREFKVGDRVRVKGEMFSSKNIPGKIGTILRVDSQTSVLVEFDEYINGHDGGYEGKGGHCWWGNALVELEFYDEKPKEEATKSHKFKVGDKVRATHPTRYGCTNSKKQWEGVVEKVSDNYFNARTTNSTDPTDIGTSFSGLDYDKFELTEEKPSVTDLDWEAFRNNKVVVRVTTRKDYDAFMKECEERGLRWNSGSKPTKWNGYHEAKGGTLIFCGSWNNDRLTKSCTGETQGKPVIDYPVTEKHWSLTITGKGDVTTAVYSEGGKEVKTETVKRYHEDKFDIRTAVDAVVDKVLPKDESKGFTGKVVCLRKYLCFTPHKVYTVTNGVMYDDASDSRNYEDISEYFFTIE